MKLGSTTLTLDRGKKVLVTGHTGFKGAWLTLMLERLGVEVCGLSLAPEETSLYARLGRRGRIQENFVDIRDYSNLQQSLREFNPQIIFHLAAQPLVLRSYESPRETFETNTMGTVNLLDIATRLETVEVISVVTTDKVYKNLDTGIVFKETDPLEGKDPYSASKVGTETAITAWRQISRISAGPKILSLRAGNVIGGGDFSDHRLLPDLIRAFSHKNVVSVRNPNSTRPWQHVIDPLNGYLLATQHVLNNGDSETFNFAPDGESLSVKQVTDLAINCWGEGVKVKIDEGSSNLEASTLQLDASRARRILGWGAKWSQEQAVISTVDWWKKVLLEEMPAKEACDQDLETLFGGTTRTL